MNRNMRTNIQNGDAVLENMRRQSESVRKTWKPKIDRINEGRGQAMGEWQEIAVTQMLETFSRAGGMTARKEAYTQPANTSFLMRHGINIIATAASGLIAHDLVSIQPIESRIGVIRYLEVKYGDDKGQFKAGDNFVSHERLGGDAGQFGYSAPNVEMESLVFDGTSANVAWTPVEPGSLKIMDDQGDVVLTDNGEGGLLDAANAAAGTIDYATGAITVTGTAPADPTADYVYDNITAPVKAPSITFNIKETPVRAISRKLKTHMAVDAMYDLNVQYGFDSETETSFIVANNLQYEIDGDIIEDLMEGASASSVSFNKKQPTAVSLLDHYEGFFSTIVEGSNNIFEATRYAHGNWTVMGMSASTIVESLASRGFVASGADANGPHYLGTYGGTAVYKTPLLSDRDAFIIGYKGDNMYQAGYVYAPYLPIVSTDFLVTSDFAASQGFSTAYGKLMNNAKLFARGAITNQ